MATNRQDIGFRLDDLIGAMEGIEKLNEKDYREAIEAGIPAGEKVARKFLLESYRASGVDTKTGQLKRAIGQSDIQFFMGKKGGSLRVSMPAGKDKKFYIAAGSVNYGRVNSKDFNATEQSVQRSISGVKESVSVRKAGAKRRQKLKQKVQAGSSKGVVKAAQGLSFRGAEVGRTKAGSASVDTTLGSATVTKAFDYYNLKPSKKQRIIGAIFREARNVLREKIRKRLRRR